MVFTFCICAYHARRASDFLLNSVFMTSVLEKFYIAVDGHFVISGWLNAQSLDSLFQKNGIKEGTNEYQKLNSIFWEMISSIASISLYSTPAATLTASGYPYRGRTQEGLRDGELCRVDHGSCFRYRLFFLSMTRFLIPLFHVLDDVKFTTLFSFRAK